MLNNKLKNNLTLNNIKIYSICFNIITLLMMAFIILEVGNRIDSILRAITSGFMNIIYLMSIERGREFLNSSNFDNPSNSDKLFFLETLQEVDKYTEKEVFLSTIILVVIFIYIAYLLIRFIMQRELSIKNLKKIEEYSSENNVVLVSKKTSNIADSFRIFSINFIFIHPSFLLRNITKEEKEFIINHEVFHGLSFDSLIKAVILSSYIFIPVLMLTYFLVPFLFEFMRPILGHTYRENINYIPFVLTALIYFYIFMKSKKFLSVFFHYKEYLADYYSYLTTDKKYAFLIKSKTKLFHPSTENRQSFLKKPHNILSVNMYFYIMLIIYMSNIAYKVPVIIIMVILSVLFIVYLKHLYISFLCVFICSSILIFSKLGWVYVFHSSIVDQGLSVLKSTDVALLIILSISYIASIYNKRFLL